MEVTDFAGTVAKLVEQGWGWLAVPAAAAYYLSGRFIDWKKLRLQSRTALADRLDQIVERQDKRIDRVEKKCSECEKHMTRFEGMFIVFKGITTRALSALEKHDQEEALGLHREIDLLKKDNPDFKELLP